MNKLGCFKVRPCLASCLFAWLFLPGMLSGQTTSLTLNDPFRSDDFEAVSNLPVQAGLPDPLIGADGKAITTAAQWIARRERMKAVIQHYALGRMPPPPGAVTGKDLATQAVLDGMATCRVVQLAFGPDAKLGFRAVLFIPAETASHHAPFPVIVHPSFEAKLGKDQTTNVLNDIAKTFAQPLQRGMAVMAFWYQQCGLDEQANYRQTGFFSAYPDYDWGDLAAWAWGMSRCVDYLQTQTFADQTKIIAVGHSRLGKATLVAGAFDERFALTAPAGSGCGGTGAYRFNGKTRGGKEGLEDVIKHFPQWFGPRMPEFFNQVEKLPFDQHWLLALVAPRLCIPADGLSDGCANGNALAKAYLGAKPVYALLGVPEHLGISFRAGGHALATDDWDAILDFADLHLRHRTITRVFDQLPAANLLR